MNFIIAFVYFLCALIFLLLIGVLVYFGTADSPVWKIWYKRVSRLLTVLAVFYVVLAVVGLFAEVGIWSFIIPIVAILSVMLLLLLRWFSTESWKNSAVSGKSFEKSRKALLTEKGLPCQ